MPGKLYAQYHKMEFRPPKQFEPTAEVLQQVSEIFGLMYSDFSDNSTTTSYQYKTAETYRKLINLEWVNPIDDPRRLNRIEVQGSAFETMPLDLGKILTVMEKLKFTLTEVHSRVLLPPSLVTFETIETHFNKNAYTSNCRLVTPITDPSNNYARTWQAGKRPASRSATMQGKRLTFYQADKVHADLPAGTTEMEIQLFGSMAHAFMYSNLTRDLDVTVRTLGVIRDYFNFKTLTGDSNISRRETPKWWRAVIADLPAIQLPRLDKPLATNAGKIKKLKETLYSRYLALGTAAFTESLNDWLHEMELWDSMADLNPVF